MKIWVPEPRNTDSSIPFLGGFLRKRRLLLFFGTSFASCSSSPTVLSSLGLPGGSELSFSPDGVSSFDPLAAGSAELTIAVIQNFLVGLGTASIAQRNTRMGRARDITEALTALFNTMMKSSLAVLECLCCCLDGAGTSAMLLDGDSSGLKRFPTLLSLGLGVERVLFILTV
ncbi:hypothetical protein EYF80_025800 [Liparis tanakae]|uniref:Uncharacterized protein n=1 Tax=Liparis tanakae TaxID=230148 RepID=A0A4Z2HDJ6_9TELE|nr:hypothetical protein EYF80_025800 [Liparis tanakae]